MKSTTFFINISQLCCPNGLLYSMKLLFGKQNLQDSRSQTAKCLFSFKFFEVAVLKVVCSGNLPNET